MPDIDADLTSITETLADIERLATEILAEQRRQAERLQAAEQRMRCMFAPPSDAGLQHIHATGAGPATLAHNPATGTFFGVDFARGSDVTVTTTLKLHPDDDAPPPCLGEAGSP